MPRPGIRIGEDEERGKKDDDHRPGDGDDLILSDVFSMRWPGWTASRRLRGMVLTLLVFTSALGIILYVAVGTQNSIDARAHHPRPSPRPRPRERPMPVPTPRVLRDPQIDAERAAIRKPTTPKSEPKISKAQKERPPEPQERDGRELQYFNGPLKWGPLSESLQEATSGPMRAHKQHVIFAAASLKSLARLAPMACEMGRWNRNLVHVAFMGRSDFDIEKIKEINGVSESCYASWHDARPDFAAYSTDDRFNLAVFMAFEHIRGQLMPPVILVDERTEEEPEFIKALDKHAAMHTTWAPTVINLPVEAVRSLQWVNRLDSGSLAAWHKAKVEILVRPPSGNSGSLVRLLHSIQEADYFGSTPPHITIEMPSDVDRHTKEFLDSFVWPPPTEDGRPQVSLVTFRKRLPRASPVNPAEASMRLIEAFYPSKSTHSHVLLLSPEAELSPQYYHYLRYNLLEYKYSTFNQWSREMHDLLGISLITPSHLLDGKTKLDSPRIPVDRKAGQAASSNTQVTPFLWQAPDTHATLYFGDKWKQLHSFFSHRMGRPDPEGGKEVSTSIPAFAEYFLELMLARGWLVLYPHLSGHEFATAHRDSYREPEEFIPPEPTKSAEAKKPSLKETLYHPGPASLPSRREKPLPVTPIHILLPHNGDLTELDRLPMVSHKGQHLTAASKDQVALSYMKTFRETVGKCTERLKPPNREDDYSADDMFCSKDREIPNPDNLPGPGAPPAAAGAVPAGGAPLAVEPPAAHDALAAHEAPPAAEAPPVPVEPSIPPPIEEEWVPEFNDKGEGTRPVAADVLKAMKNELALHLDRQKDRQKSR